MINIQMLKGSYQDISIVPLPQTTMTPTQFHLVHQFGGAGGGGSFFAVHSLNLEGAGFTYSGDVLTGGIITRVGYTRESGSSNVSGSTYNGGSQAYDGLAIDAAQFMAAYLAQDSVGMHELLFAGGVLFNGVASPTPLENSADNFNGTGARDILLGRAGNDILSADGGDDYMAGGMGDDALLAGSGADLVFGEDGADFVWGGDGSDIALLGDGDDTAFGEAGDDALYGEAGNDALQGGAGADFIAGGSGNDYAWGQEGNDYLLGEGGIDTMFGGTGDDALVGGSDGDALYGEDGSDALFGGNGNDYFVGGTGADFLYVMHAGPTAGEQDYIDGFEVAASGTADWIVIPAAYQGATSFFDSSG